MNAALRRIGRRSHATVRARPSDRQPLRVAVVGLGTIGRVHAEQLNRSNFFALTGICSGSAAPEDVAREFGCALTRTIEELITQVRPEVIVVATPHKVHKNSAVPALKAGIHVICEKPMAVSVAHVEIMMQAAKENRRLLTVMSQTRFEPTYLKIRSLLDSGEFGPLRRCTITETFLRSTAYYQRASWRGTWAGEGGGVLVNQAPHVLDRYRWLCGCPERITAVCETLHHSISVEDSATLLCSHANGMIGQIHVSTNEHPQSRLELLCDRGGIVVQDGSITVTNWTPSLSESIDQTSSDITAPVMHTKQLGGRFLNWSDSLLHDFYEDFATAVWSGGEPFVSANEAADVVQMINAAQLSAWKGCPMTLPLDSREYQEFLETIIAGETVGAGK